MVRRRRSQSSLATKLVLIVNQGLMLPGKQQLAHSFLERNGPFVRFLRVASPGIRVQTVNNVSTPRDQDALLAQRCEPLANLVVEGWRLRFVNAQLHDGNLTLWINGGGAPPKRHGRAPSVRQVAPAAEPATDRKSTRLNSSHVAISYAVFCLKKKSEITFSTSFQLMSRCI